MTARRLVLTLVALAALAAPALKARRLPAPGGKVTLSLPPDLVRPTTEAHLYVPIVEAVVRDDDAARLARPPLKTFAAWRSSVITNLEVDAKATKWTLTVDAPAPFVADAVERCLSEKTTDSWPAAVLGARGVTATVQSSGNSQVTVLFSAAVGPLPELLAGCPLRGQNVANTGPFVVVSPGVLASRGGALAPQPLFGVVELVAANARADLVAFGAETPGSVTLLAPFPDVVVLLQSERARAEDVLGLSDSSQGLTGFVGALRPDLLAAAYAQGRGASVDGLLPPGVAPARPLKSASAPERPLSLSLVELGADAPRVVVRRPEADALIDGVVDRLALLLRNRGRLVELHRAGDDAVSAQGIELLRWRPPSTDPALALLSLAGARKELRATERARAAIADPRLLSLAREERVAAALTLERAWIEEGLAVPLMTADRWFTADPDLRGVVIRPDGVPLIDNAYFAGTWQGTGGMR